MFVLVSLQIDHIQMNQIRVCRLGVIKSDSKVILKIKNKSSKLLFKIRLLLISRVFFISRTNRYNLLLTHEVDSYIHLNQHNKFELI